LRLLFCLPTATLSGGVKVIFELANRLIASGDNVVDVFSFGRSPQWFALKAHLIEAKDIEDVDFAKYDLVIVSNAFMVPLVLSNHPQCRCVLLCQDYESFHHARGRTFDDFISDDPTFTEIYKLPIPLISTSRPVQSLLRQRVGIDSHRIQVGINKEIFFPRPRKRTAQIKRVLLIGNYLMPYKGMKDGFEALRKLSGEMPVQLVMVTQESRGRAILDGLPYPIELHFCPTEEVMPEIIASCDIYCCASWYEGLGLPALEAFCCGVPVVSTRTYGVSEYGVDEVNLLLARPNDPLEIYEKMKRLLVEATLAERLREAAFKTVAEGYDWDACVASLTRILLTIRQSYADLSPQDPRLMRDLSAKLEAAGNLTPIATFRRFDHLTDELASIVSQIRSEKVPMHSLRCRLQNLRDGFATYLGNEKVEYYDAFKSKYDFCQLLLGLWLDERFAEYLEIIVRRRDRVEPPSSTSFSEIRYSNREPRTRGMGRPSLFIQRSHG
jgi:glycosyltransferase involved in cell wall biosynthesis